MKTTIYLCHFISKTYGKSVPMAAFSNEKAAKDYVNTQKERENDEDIKWYYYDMDLEDNYWWK